MKKFITLIGTLSVIFILTACGNSSSAKYGKSEIYGTTITHMGESTMHNIIAKGETDAPDGSKILVSGTNEDSIEYGENAGESTDLAKWATVKDGKFEVDIDPIDLTSSEKIKSGKKVSFVVFAVTNYDKKWTSGQIPKSMVSKAKDVTDTTKATFTKKMEKYYSNLDNNSDDSSSDDSTPKKHTNVDVNSFNTGITYDQLSRTPDQYKNKKIKFTGEVAQAINQDGVTEIRLAVNGNYDNMILVDILNADLNGSRVLEDDLVTFYGTSNGIAKYKSTSGAPIEIPSALAEKVTDSGKASDDYGE